MVGFVLSGSAFVTGWNGFTAHGKLPRAAVPGVHFGAFAFLALAPLVATNWQRELLEESRLDRVGVSQG